MDVELWKRVVGSPQYDAGILNAALAIAKRLQDKTNPTEANLFDDLFAVFFTQKEILKY